MLSASCRHKSIAVRHGHQMATSPGLGSPSAIQYPSIFRIQPEFVRDEISTRNVPAANHPYGGTVAQIIESSFICDGRFRVFAIKPVGRKTGRIIEIEEVDTGKRVHGTARKLERLVLSLRRSTADADGVTA
jgi:hypothetical protein